MAQRCCDIEHNQSQIPYSIRSRLCFLLFFVDISSVYPSLSGRPVSLPASHVRDLSLLVRHSGLFFFFSCSLGLIFPFICCAKPLTALAARVITWKGEVIPPSWDRLPLFPRLTRFQPSSYHFPLVLSTATNDLRGKTPHSPLRFVLICFAERGAERIKGFHISLVAYCSLSSLLGRVDSTWLPGFPFSSRVAVLSEQLKLCQTNDDYLRLAA